MRESKYHLDDQAIKIELRARAKIRTWDLTSISRLLYQLSYTRTQSNFAYIEYQKKAKNQGCLDIISPPHIIISLVASASEIGLPAGRPFDFI